MNEITKYALMGLLAISMAGYATRVGEPREPITKKDAVLSILINTLVILAISKWW